MECPGITQVCSLALKCREPGKKPDRKLRMKLRKEKGKGTTTHKQTEGCHDTT